MPSLRESRYADDLSLSDVSVHLGSGSSEEPYLLNFGKSFLRLHLDTGTNRVHSRQ